MIATVEGNVVLENVGSGVALNVRYDFKQITPARDGISSNPGSSLPHIPPGKAVSLAVPRGIFTNKVYEVTCTYESLGRRRYQTCISLNNLVITRVVFDAERRTKD